MGSKEIKKDTTFNSIDLPNVGQITRKGYYNAEISGASSRVVDGKQILKVEFTVSRGKYTGFQVDTKFYETQRSRYRLGYLCQAVGIEGKLNALIDLIGKSVKLRIVPKYVIYRGKSTVQYRITRFHPVDQRPFGSNR